MALAITSDISHLSLKISSPSCENATSSRWNQELLLWVIDSLHSTLRQRSNDQREIANHNEKCITFTEEIIPVSEDKNGLKVSNK